MTAVRAPFRYFGSKVQMAPWIIPRLPHHRHYIEACAGSAAVLAVKPPVDAETVNDVYGHVVNFFAVLRDPAAAEQLIDMVTFTPYSRAEFLDCLEHLDDDTTPVMQAWRFLIAMQMAVVPGRTGWSYTVDAVAARKANKAGRWYSMPDLLRVCAHRFRNVHVESRDVVDLIERYDHPDTLFFVDPPYAGESRPNSPGVYVHDRFDHDGLAEAVRSSSASFAITHYPHPFYDAMADWTGTDDFVSHRNRPNNDGDNTGRDEQVERLYLLDRSGRPAERATLF